ncbi:hypothetical protein Tco_0939805 [Tanacetum coccineum]|uniref:Xylulose kinase-1 n=1 Tax=Tanacetum coccineum TaxID=301880 RepID=A0ABQ5DLN3_9ASTR
MSSSKFAETHNLVAFLEKPVGSEGFEQIIDFLNASSINYALTINPTIYHSCVQQFWESAKVKTVNDEVQIQALIDKKRVVITEATIRRDLKLRDTDGIACLPNESIFAELARMGVIIPLFDTMMVQAAAEVDPDLNQPSTSQPQQKQKSKRKQRREVEVFSTVPTTSSNDPPHSGEDTLKKRVKKLEGRRRKRSSGLRRLKKVGMGAKVVSSDDEGLVDKEDASKQGRNDEEEMVFDVDADLQGEEVIVDEAQKVVEEVIEDITTAGKEEAISTAPQVTTAPITSVELTLAQTLVEIRNAAKPKVKGISIVEPSEATTTTTKIVQSLGCLLKRRHSLKKEQNEAKTITEWDNVQATIDADRRLSEQLQAEEREHMRVDERSRLLAELIEENKKFFVAKRAKVKRNKPPTKAQQRKMMCTYLKNMAGYKMQDLRHFDDGTIKEKFDKAFARTNEFVPVEKEKHDDDIEDSELLQLIDFTLETKVDVVPLATKTPIIGWNVLKEGKRDYFNILRAEGQSQKYLIFGHMLRDFNKEDIKYLWKLMKSKYGSAKPKDNLDYVLWNDLKNMFEPDLEDNIWRRQDGYKVLEWKLYESCGVHFLRMQSCQFYMLVEKKYPLTVVTLKLMLEQTLRTSHQSKMAYEMASKLLKFILKQIPGAYEAYKKDKSKNK